MIAWLKWMFRPQKDRDMEYLNESIDIYDLERRMRELDRRKSI